MTNSILTSVKKMLDLSEDDSSFDTVVMIHINSVFATLSQVGVGPPGGFMIEDASVTWDAFLNGDKRYNMVKSYVYLAVRILFDPPSTSFVIAAQKEIMAEQIWRISSEREGNEWTPPARVVVPREDNLLVVDGGSA